MNRKGLLYLYVSQHEGLTQLRQKVFYLMKFIKPLQASSVYKRHHSEDPKDRIEVVLEADIPEQDLDNLYYELKSQQTTLLALEGEMRVDPERALPHPLLALDFFVLKMAAECSPYWEHGVKHETLQALSNKNLTNDSVEFLTQGKALIKVLA